MNRKTGLVIVSLLLLVVLLVGACAKQAPPPAPAPKPSPAPTPAPAPSAAPIKLVNTVNTPPPPPTGGSSMAELNVWFADEVAKQTEGRVTIENKWGSPFGPPDKYLDLIGKPGMADMGQTVVPYFPWVLSLTYASSLPFIARGTEAEPKALTQVYKEWAPMRQEYDKRNVMPLFFAVGSQSVIGSKGAPIRTVADFKGKKIWSSGIVQDVVRALGGDPVTFPSGELYDALSKGTVHAYTYAAEMVVQRKLYEQTDQLVNLDWWGSQGAHVWTINKDAWSKISAKDQNTILAIAAKALDKKNELDSAGAIKVFQTLRDKKVNFYTVAPAEQEKMKQAAASVTDNWVKEAESKGIPAQEAVSKYKALIQQLTSQDKVKYPWPSE